MFVDAASTALEQKDLTAMNFILACSNTADARTQEKIREMMASLKSGLK